MESLLVVYFSTFFFIPTATSTVETERFVKAGWCSGQALNEVHRYHSQASRSNIECMVTCRKDPACLSADFDAVHKLCHLSSVTAKLDCSNMEPASEVKHYEITGTNRCLNGGTDDGNGGCVCSELYCGPTCETVVQDCQDIMDCKGLSLTPKTFQWIWPATASSPFQVLCNSVGASPRTMICARTVPTLNFSRSWQDYKNGFGSFSSNDFNHWLGLEKVHLLTNNRAYQLRFSLSIQNKTQYFGFYPNFVVSSEASGYAFSLSTPPDFPLLDCLSPLEGAPFSTYDNDNDGETSVNCAERHGGGFWFKGPECSTICNVFGQLLQPADDRRSGIPDEVFWSMRHVAVDLAPKKMFLYLISK